MPKTIACDESVIRTGGSSIWAKVRQAPKAMKIAKKTGLEIMVAPCDVLNGVLPCPWKNLVPLRLPRFPPALDGDFTGEDDRPQHRERADVDQSGIIGRGFPP
jgi:hypothetical protein